MSEAAIKSVKHSILCILFLLFQFQLSAEWSAEALKFSESYSHPYTDGFASTLSGVCEAPDRKEKDFVAPVEIREYQDNRLKNGPFPVKLVLLQQDGAPKKAPLFIYIPGAFSNLDNGQPRRWMDEATKMGYHGLTVPNPWGTDFQKLYPEAPVGDIVNEADILYTGIRKAVQELIEEDLVDQSMIRISGVSYGSFLTAMLAAKDASHEEPIGFYDASIYSAPFNLGRTLDRLDALIEESKDPFNGIDLVSLLIRYKRFCAREKQSDLSEYHLETAKGLSVYQGFHEELVTSVLVYDKVRDLNSIPDRFWGSLSSKYRKWKREFNFAKYFDVYSPEVKTLLTSHKGDLFHWIEMAREHGFSNFRIFNADDDFLNELSVWNPLVTQNPKTLILVPDGGHYGFRHLEWFATLFQKAYGLDSKTQLFKDLHSH